MKTRYKALIGISISALLIVSVLFLQSIHSAKAKTVNTQTNQTFDKLPPGLAPAVANAFQKNLPESYQVKKAGKSYQADNEAHGMQYTFTPNGPLVQGADSSWEWGMSLTQWGYEKNLQAVPIAELTTCKDRVEYKRGQTLTEWYKNTAFGLEQGFTLEKQPASTKSKNSSLTLEIAITGAATPKLEGKTLLLQNKKGETLSRYTGLYAYDSNHQELPARMVLADNTLSILVDDSKAAYPVTIDPWVQQAKLTPGAGTWPNDQFGSSIAVSGSRIVVGVPYTTGVDDGAAFVFEKPVTDNWSSTSTCATKLIASDHAADDRFGYSVSIDSITIVVGAYKHDTGAGETDAGAAYVFVRPKDGWAGETTTETAKLMAGDRQANDQFGTSVSVDNYTVVVGAPREDLFSATNSGNYGAAYVFQKPITGWVSTDEPEAKLYASDYDGDEESEDLFGTSVDIDGDTIVVGAVFESYHGSAYVFEKPGATWSDINETAKLTSLNGPGTSFETNCIFGKSVAISGGTIVVGEPGHNGVGYDSGAAYVFEKPVTGWASTNNFDAKLTASDAADSDYFGYSVDISDDIIVIGAYGYEIDAGETNAGAAFVFKKPSAGWDDMTETVKRMANDRAEGDFFGNSVAVSGTTIVVGAPKDDDDASEAGSAYVYVFESPASLPWMIPLLLN